VWYIDSGWLLLERSRCRDGGGHPRSDPQVALGQAIRQTRLARGLSQEQVAHGADLHPTWISHIEGGSNPAWGTVRRIASALGVEVSELAKLAEQIEER
jgi:transcriptional regulator with XRE-family HTH domain